MRFPASVPYAYKPGSGIMFTNKAVAERVRKMRQARARWVTGFHPFDDADRVLDDSVEAAGYMDMMGAVRAPLPLPQSPARGAEIPHPQLQVVRASEPRTLTVAVRSWPLDTPLRRPSLSLDALLWRSSRPLPNWLRRYILVEVPVPTATPPTIVSPFRDDMASIPSCLAVQGILAAIHGACSPMRTWTHLTPARPAFSWRKPGGTITTSIRPPLWGEHPPGPSSTSAWEVAGCLDDLDGDVLLIVLAHALMSGEPGGMTWITADAILDDRGIRPKTERVGTARYRAGHRHEDRARVAACMERLECLWVDLAAVAVIDEPRGGRPRRDRRDDEGALLIISDRLVQGYGAEERPVAWCFRPGPWLAPFLARPNRQTALLARQVLRYDPYHERWEKRLGRYLTFHLRMDAKRAVPLIRRIGPLLDELCLPVDRRHPERTRTRLEAALNRLVRDRVIGEWEYTAKARATLAALAARRWVDQWRQLTISFAPTPTVAARYAHLSCNAARTAASRPEPDAIAPRAPETYAS
jgi:hypothetical protein